MSSSTVNALLIIGVLGVGVAAFVNRCEWLKWCDPLPDSLANIETLIKNTFKGTVGNTQQGMQQLADAIEGGKLTQDQFNSLPTIGNTQDSNYRSVRQSAPGTAGKNPPVNSPASSYIKPANTSANKNSFCSDPKNKANYKNICGFYASRQPSTAISLLGLRMSI